MSAVRVGPYKGSGIKTRSQKPLFLIITTKARVRLYNLGAATSSKEAEGLSVRGCTPPSPVAAGGGTEAAAGCPWGLHSLRVYALTEQLQDCESP